MCQGALRPDLAKVAKFFDDRAPTYDNNDMHHWLVKRAVEIADIRTGESVLDVATGTGLGLGAAIDRARPLSHAVGIDISAGMLAVAQANLSNADVCLILADAMQLPFGNEVFDQVLCIASLAYLADSSAGLREWVRVARDGGRVTITSFAAGGIMSQALIRSAAQREGIWIPDPNVHWGSKATFVKYGAAGGLRDITVSEVTHSQPFGDPETAWLNFIRSDFGQPLRSVDAVVREAVRASYRKEQNRLAAAGSMNTQTSLVLSGIVGSDSRQ